MSRGTKVYKYSISGNFIAEYSSMSTAAKANGMIYTAISNAVVSNGQSGGFQWRKERFDSLPPYDIKKGYKQMSITLKKRIDMFSLSGQYIRSFDSALDASKELGFEKSGIRGACIGKYDFSNGYIWRYAHGVKPRRNKSKGRQSPIKYADLPEAVKIKSRASASARDALKKGKIERKTSCERCGAHNRRMQMHHEDYGKPLDIVWLCRPCHVVRHEELKMMGIKSLPV